MELRIENYDRLYSCGHSLLWTLAIIPEHMRDDLDIPGHPALDATNWLETLIEQEHAPSNAGKVPVAVVAEWLHLAMREGNELDRYWIQYLTKLGGELKRIQPTLSLGEACYGYFCVSLEAVAYDWINLLRDPGFSADYRQGISDVSKQLLLAARLAQESSRSFFERVDPTPERPILKAQPLFARWRAAIMSFA